MMGEMVNYAKQHVAQPHVDAKTFQEILDRVNVLKENCPSKLADFARTLLQEGLVGNPVGEELVFQTFNSVEGLVHDAELESLVIDQLVQGNYPNADRLVELLDKKGSDKSVPAFQACILRYLENPDSFEESSVATSLHFLRSIDKANYFQPIEDLPIIEGSGYLRALTKYLMGFGRENSDQLLMEILLVEFDPHNMMQIVKYMLGRKNATMLSQLAVFSQQEWLHQEDYLPIKRVIDAGLSS
jgi:hypothetical protein